MIYQDKKFAAAIKDSPYFLYLHWREINQLGGEELVFNYAVPDEDLGNISLYAARNILEGDIMFAARNNLDTSLVEIIEVIVNYSFTKNNNLPIDEKAAIE